MRKEFNIVDLLKDNMETRYALPPMNTFRGSNGVIDSYYPTIMVSRSDEEIKSRTACAISPVVSKMLHIPQLHISDLCALLGYKKKDIKNILTNVKSKNESLYLIGAGGVGSNFVYFGEQLCNWTNTINIFNKIVVYDDDVYDITNIPRIPFDLSNRESITKSLIVSREVRLLSSNVENYCYKINRTNFTNRFETYYENNIVYGAPDIETREAIYDYNQENETKIRFVSATHGGDTCMLQSCPEQNNSLQVEAYGMIDLGIFFMNQLMTTIKFFEQIADGVDMTITQELFEFNFRDLVDNNQLGSASKTINFVSPKQEVVRQEFEEPIEEELDEEIEDLNIEEAENVNN